MAALMYHISIIHSTCTTHLMNSLYCSTFKLLVQTAALPVGSSDSHCLSHHRIISQDSFVSLIKQSGKQSYPMKLNGSEQVQGAQGRRGEYETKRK